MDKDFLTLGIISALVAGKTDAVTDMLVMLAKVDARHAEQIMLAIKRGTDARSTSTPKETNHG